MWYLILAVACLTIPVGYAYATRRRDATLEGVMYGIFMLGVLLLAVHYINHTEAWSRPVFTRDAGDAIECSARHCPYTRTSSR